MSRRKLTDAERADLKAQWCEFVEAIFSKTGWSEAQLAARVGCSVPCVSRWRDTDPATGRIPSRAAGTTLVALARELGLID